MIKKQVAPDEILVTKRTMEDVFRYQEKLRKLIEELIEENRPLDTLEIDDYYYLIAHSTMGLGVSKMIKLNVPDSIELGTCEYVARWMGRQKTIQVPVTLPGSLVTHILPIRQLWEPLLYSLFEVFPLAIEKSASMSRESDATLGGDAYGFNPLL